VLYRVASFAIWRNVALIRLSTAWVAQFVRQSDITGPPIKRFRIEHEDICQRKR
jgi:hypothetical protein